MWIQLLFGVSLTVQRLGSILQEVASPHGDRIASMRVSTSKRVEAIAVHPVNDNNTAKHG